MSLTLLMIMAATLWIGASRCKGNGKECYVCIEAQCLPKMIKQFSTSSCNITSQQTQPLIPKYEMTELSSPCDSHNDASDIIKVKVHLYHTKIRVCLVGSSGGVISVHCALTETERGHELRPVLPPDQGWIQKFKHRWSFTLGVFPDDRSFTMGGPPR